MLDLNQRFITDAEGNRVAVILDLETFQRLLDSLEDRADLQAYRESKAQAGEIIPFEQAVHEIEQKRQGK